MSTVVIPFNPPVTPTTTSAPEVFTTQAVVCTVISHDMPDLMVRKSRAIGIPQVNWSSPSGGKAQLIRLVIVAVPSAGDGVLKINGATLANGAQVSPASMAKIVFEAAETFDGATFTYKVQTSCGESSVYTATIGLAAEPAAPCNCNEPQ